MEPKKNPQKDLDKKRSIFFLSGLVVALALVLIAINYKSYNAQLKDLGTARYQLDDEQEVQEVALQIQPPPPPSPPPPPTTEIQVVENDQEVEDVEIKSADVEEAPVEIVDKISDVGEQVDNATYTFAVVESQPVYPGCEKYPTKQAKYQCFEHSIERDLMKYLNRKLDADRAGSGGRSFVKFTIGKDGGISEVQVGRAPNEYLKNLSAAAVKSLPKMTPAKQRDQPVKVTYTLPVNVRIQ